MDNIIKKWWFWLIIIFIVFVLLLFFIKETVLPDYDECSQLVERENAFCANLDQQDCILYDWNSQSIPDGGHCEWNNITDTCRGVTGGCD